MNDGWLDRWIMGHDAPVWGGGLLQLALILLLLFWIVGAHNRLMRLRSALGPAWLQIDELLLRRSAALDMLVAAVRETLTEEAGSLQALTVAQDAQRLAALAVRPRPHSAELLQAWLAAERAMVSPLARLHALVEQHPELDASEGVRPARQLLAELAPRLIYARQAYSQPAEAYNAALQEFPTRLLTTLFGFKPAAPL
ncbi:LemA family protein [Ideonella sp.]|uniref:LemA family protein n=1 Tax=Ideonella sp. TaxID=1929293 RepID=UPI003BB647D7